MISLLLYASFTCIQLATAKDTLKILTTSPMTGSGKSTGIPCLKAMEIAVNATNADDNLLKEFQLEMIPVNDAYGPLGVSVTMDFYRTFIEDEQSSGKEPRTWYPSPVVTGYINSRTCMTTAPILPHVDMVLVAAGCISPVFTANQFKFRNLFRIRKGVEMYIGPIAEYMKEFQWDKVAVLFSASSVVGFTLADQFMKVAPDYNITVKWSNNVNSIDDDIANSLRQSHIRIIILTNSEPPIATAFVCELYKQGFNNSQYLIISLATTFQQKQYLPPVVPGGCTGDELLSMYNYVLFVGSKPFAIEDTGPISKLEYGLDKFNDHFYKAIAGIEQDDLPEIQFCHDAMLATIIGLHETNERLLARNMTLRNYLDKPRLVIEEVKETLRSISFKGIREENYRYSSRIEFDEEPIVLMQWVENERWAFPSAAYWNSSGNFYSLDTSSSIQWNTLNGKAPQGWPIFVNVLQDVHVAFFIVITIVMAIAVAIELYIFYKHGQKQIISSCILLNIAGVVFAIPTGMLTYLLPICFIRLILVALGVSILVISEVLEIVQIWRQLKHRKVKENPRKSKKKGMSSSTSNKIKVSAVEKDERLSTTITARQSKMADDQQQQPLKKCVIGIVLLVAYLGLLTVWLAVDNHRKIESNDENNIHYDQYSDTYTTETYKDCTSDNFSIWGSTLVIVLVVPAIFLSTIIAIGGRLKKATGQEKLALVSIVNIISIILITIFAVLLVHSIVAQRIILTIACLVLSLSTTALLKFRGNTNATVSGQ